MTTYTLLAFTATLVVFGGTAAMIDSALTAVSPARSAELAEQKVRGAQALQKVCRDLPRHLNLLILLRVSSEVGAVTLVAMACIKAWGVGWLGVGVTVASMAVVSFVLIGVGPRTVGRQHAYPVALAAAGPMRVLTTALGPLARLLIAVGNALTPGRGFREGPFSTSQTEIREMVGIAERSGVVEHGERTMIESVFALGDTVARAVMVPRTEMVSVEATQPASEAVEVALRSGFSRIPVVGEDLDDVLGMAYLKDLVNLKGSNPPVREVMRQVSFVPESKPVDDLLREMQAERIHIAMVVDEFGGTAGLVTIEDILEEIVGEITDEYDNERPPVEWLEEGDLRARVTARLSVEDLQDLFAVDMDDVDVDTVAGLMAHQLGKVPITGDRAHISGLELIAEGAEGRRNRIDTVVVRKLAEPAPVPPTQREEINA